MTFWLGSWLQGSLCIVQSNSRWLSVSVPLWTDWLQFVVTRVSARRRCATRAASPLRAATVPARLATCIASSATGITIAMNTRAASTSASVKAAHCAMHSDCPGLFLCAGNLITDPIPRLPHPKRRAVPVGQAQCLGAGLAEGTVRQKAYRRQVRMHERNTRHAGGAGLLRSVHRDDGRHEGIRSEEHTSELQSLR